MAQLSPALTEHLLIGVLDRLETIMKKEAAFRRSEAGIAAEAKFQAEVQKRADFAARRSADSKARRLKGF